MTTRKILAVVLTGLLALAGCSKPSLQQTVYYVSGAGDDAWSGRIPRPSPDRTDGPFASLERARNAIEEIITTQAAIDREFVVNIRGGVYPLSRSLEFAQTDSGGKICKITWQAQSGEKVLLIGARPITGIQAIGDAKIRSRIDPALQDKILACNLKTQGIADYGTIGGRATPGLELFFQGQRMRLARYPNEGWLTIADVPQTGTTLFNRGLEREKRYDGVPVGRHYGRIRYDGERPNRWSADNEIYLHGYWTWDWSDSYQSVASIDRKNREITLAEPHHHYGYTKNQRYYFLNILEELDQPGEWALDRQNGWLYFYPPAPLESGELLVSLLTEPLIKLNQCRNLTLQGIDFAYSRGKGVVVRGGSNNLIAGCTFQYLGDDAIVIDGGTGNGVHSCDIHQVSMGGIQLKGGDRKKLLLSNNFAVNNHIYDYSNWIRTGQMAILVDGVGLRVAHNVIHDAPHGAIYVRGNEHVLEFNEIYRVCNETGDAGAIHTGRNYTWRGNIYRYNYVHHLKGPGLHGCTALYLDDFTSGYTLYGNICYQSGRGVLLGGGRDNRVENNIFIACAPAIVLDARGLSWASNYFDGTLTVLKDSLEAMNYRQPPYSVKYPELLTLYDDDPAVPKNNHIRHNVSTGGRWLELYDYFAYSPAVLDITDNVIADSIIYKRVRQKPAGWEPYYLNLDTEADYIYLKKSDLAQWNEFPDNLVLDSDPGFVDPANGDFHLRRDAPAFSVGFKPIPFEKIGLYPDNWRKKLPE